jgi:outer membrane protein OmpA-like peptidoglycan-associated protein
MANNNNNKNKNKNKAKPSRPPGSGTTGSASPSGSSGAAGSTGTSGSADRSTSSSAGGTVRTDTTTVQHTAWERRKAWPLLLGSAAVLTGASALNYSWANPDGKLTSKAQSALSAKYPGAEVRVHGRDAIITGLPAGADADAAHALVRTIEGVRNVKEEAGAAPVATETVAAETVAAETVAAETVAATEAVVTEAAPAAVVETTAVAETTVAPTTTPPPTTVAPTTTEAPTTTVAPVVEAPAEAPAEASATTAPPPMKILFDTTSSLLEGESATSVEQLTTYLQGNPDVKIKVVGHADNYGTRLTNLAISRARADAVVSALVSAGIDRSRISAFAQGSRLPVESNATAEGRRANRRVEIVFFGAEGSGGRDVAFTG